MKHWQRVITLLLVIAILGISLVISGCGKSSDESSKSEESQIIEVSRGTLLTTVSAIGSISMPNQANLTFGSSGAVSEVRVVFGETVKEGQVLARLDTSSLERAVTQAEASLRTAQINLEKAKEPYSAADIAKAEAAVESAKATLAAAEDALAEAKDPYSATDIAKAEAAVESAKATLASAEDALEEAINPYSAADIAKAEAVVESAKATLASAEDALEEAKNPYSDLDIANAEAAVRDARVALENAQRSLIVAQQNGEISITDAENSLSDAEETYNDFVRANIANLTVPNIAEQKDRLWGNVEKARKDLEIAETQAASSIKTAVNNVTKAEETLRNAEENLAEMKADPVLVQQKKSQVATARAALAKAEEDLAERKAGPDPHEVELKQIQVDNAQVALEDSLEWLEEATIVAPFDGVVANVAKLSS